MKERYSVYCAEELEGLEINSYVLTMNEAFKMAKELFFEVRAFGGKYRDWETDRKSTRLNSSH